MKARYTFYDAAGLTLATSVPIFDTPLIIAQKLQKYSSSKLAIMTNWTTAPIDYTPPAPGAYPGIGDVAVLSFDPHPGSYGGTLRVTLPSPVDAVFLGDGETVDPSAIADLIAAIQAHALMPDELQAVGNYTVGYRRKLTERKY